MRVRVFLGVMQGHPARVATISLAPKAVADVVRRRKCSAPATGPRGKADSTSPGNFMTFSSTLTTCRERCSANGSAILSRLIGTEKLNRTLRSCGSLGLLLFLTLLTQARAMVGFHAGVNLGRLDEVRAGAESGDVDTEVKGGPPGSADAEREAVARTPAPDARFSGQSDCSFTRRPCRHRAPPLSVRADAKRRNRPLGRWGHPIRDLAVVGVIRSA